MERIMVIVAADWVVEAVRRRAKIIILAIFTYLALC